MALLVAACSEEKGIDPVNPTPGKDVVFDASATTQSRTEYQQPNADGSYPIWWMPGDQMLVMSPQCAVKYGQYEVGTTVNATGSASAGVLQKKSPAGVQWGEDATADFYSVYPYKKVEQGGIKPESRTVTMRMPHIQNDYIFNKGTAENPNYYAKADMDASFLYAQTNDVANGSDVKLGYKSLSTAIRFTLVGPKEADAESVNIQYIKITAASDTKIAGRMDVTFPAGEGEMPTVKYDAADSYDHVYIYSSYSGSEGGGYLTLKRNQNIELNAFVMPEADCNISGWTIEVKTLTKTFIKTLGSGNLKRGMIHQLGNLPALDADNTNDWQTENWMTNIPRNTYLTEISIPGSWNSLNDDAQGDSPSIASQYAAGARAFHLDCRYKRTNTGTTFRPNYTYDLGIANGGATSSGSSDKYMTDSNCPTFSEALKSITDSKKSDEYMVILCTFAQNSGIPSGRTWYNDVSTACTENTDVIDASTITPATTLGDVLGKVVVIVNMEGEITPANLPADSKCFFVNAPLTLSESMFANANSYNKGAMYAKQASTSFTMYNTQAQICGNTQSTSSSNRGYGPSLTQRKTVAGGILDWSRTNYGKTDYNHSTLLYMGLGGYYTTGSGTIFDPTVEHYDAVAKDLNAWIKGMVTNMSATPTGSQTNYYPVGIVLMNMVTETTVDGPDTMKQILLLNSLYQKAFDPNKPAWPETGSNTPANKPSNYSSSHVNGGNAWNVNQ